MRSQRPGGHCHHHRKTAGAIARDCRNHTVWGDAPDPIIVGIRNTNRSRDLTPTHSILDSKGKKSRGFKPSGGGDQFIALQKGRRQPGDDGRHFGLVVDDKDAVRAALTAAGVQVLPGRFLDFLDPWGNRIEIVGYDNIQFTKAPNVLRGMGLTHLRKNANAIKELTDKGMAPE